MQTETKEWRARERENERERMRERERERRGERDVLKETNDTLVSTKQSFWFQQKYLHRYRVAPAATKALVSHWFVCLQIFLMVELVPLMLAATELQVLL